MPRNHPSINAYIHPLVSKNAHIATLLALVTPFLPPSSTSISIPLYLPPALFLAYTALALPRTARAIVCFLRHPGQGQNPASNTSPNLTAHAASSSSFTSWFRAPSGLGSHLGLGSSLLSSTSTFASPGTIRRPITIHVATQRTSCLHSLSLPSPASSSASLPLDSEQSHSISSISSSSSKSHRHANARVDAEADDSGIELEIKLPRHNHNHKDRRYRHHHHEKTTSVDSSTSTVTAVDHKHALSLSLPFGLGPLPTIESDVELQYHGHEGTNGGNLNASVDSSRHHHLFRTSNPSNSNNNHLRTQLLHSRARSLLVFLLAAQLTALVAYACAVGADIGASGSGSASLSSSWLSGSTSTAGIGPNSASATLRIVQTACMVLAVTGTMSAYLLHAYNTHLSPLRRAPKPSASADTTTTTNTHNSGNTNNAPSSALPTSAIYTPNTSSYSNAYPTNYGSQTCTPIPAQMGQRPTQTQTQTIDVTPGAHASSRPVVIQLAPPPPPRTRRRRADAIPFGMGGGVSGLESPQSNTYSHSHSNSGSSGSHGHDREHEHDALEPSRASAEVDYYYDYSRRASSYMEGQGVYARQREPIVLTYEPPKPKQADGSSFETTDTEREMEMEMSAEMSAEAEGEVVDAEEEAEMERDKEKGAARALLSRSGSLSIPVGGGARGPRTRNGSVRRTSVKRRTSGGKAYAATKSHPSSSSSHSYWRTKSKPVDDPNTYIRKRGLVPPAAQPKRFFGWEFGWDAAPLDGESRSRSRGGSKVNSKTAKGGVASTREMKEREESSFIDLRGDHGFGRGLGLGLGLASGSGNGNGKEKEKRKLKRHSMLSSVSTVRSPLDGGVNGYNYGDAEKVEDLRGQDAIGGETGRKLKKRSESSSRPGTADSTVPLPVLPYSHRLSNATVTTGSPVSASAPAPPLPPSSPSGIAFCLGRGFGLGHRKVKSGSSGSGSRPGTADSYASYASANSGVYGKGEASKRGLQLKKSFKLGVGRTLGPGLTLAVASGRGGDSVGGIRERGKRADDMISETVKDEEDVDVDEDGDIRSIAAARLVSASVARVTPAATILAAPGTPSPRRTSYSSAPSDFTSPSQESTPNANGRPVRPTIVTVGPAASLITMQNPLSPIGRTPSSSITPKTSKSTWKPHPFADPAEELIPMPSPTRIEVEVEVDDDVVQLEREMEEIRGMKDDCRDSDNEKALLDFNATLSPVVPPLADKAKPNDVPANDEKAFGCHAQKRNALSSPPVPKSDWAPQSASATTGGFPYRFPMIFPSSLTSSSASGSPPRTSVFSLSSQQNQPNSAPSTPRGGQATLRLSTKTMDTVRNAFAGVGARMSSATARMSVNGGAGGSTRGGLGSRFGETVMEDSDGDFMDLRDPFASPPPATSKLLGGMMKNRKSGIGAAKEGDNFLLIDSYEPEDVDGRGRRMMMSAWGKFPMPVRSLSPIPSSGAPSTASVKRNSKGTTRTEGKPATGHRKHKKEKRTKKATLPSMANALSSAKAGTLRAGDEDADFGLEEALLSQRLLRSLDSDHWEGRA